MTGERLVRRFEVKEADVDTGARTFSGLASTWERDLGDDVVQRGAFTKTLSDWRGGGRTVPLIDQHRYMSVRDVVGKLAGAEERDAGLWTEWQIVPGSDGDQVLERLKGGYVDGLSIGYRPVKWEIEENDGAALGQIRHLKEIDLKEVSVVVWPMNEGARVDVQSIKSLIENASEEERAALRELLAPDPEPEPGPATYDPEKAAALTGRLAARRFARRLEPLRRGRP